MSIGSQIKSRRKELKISQEDLAKKIGVSRSAVSNWEIERNYPDLQIIVSLSEVLGLSLDALLKEDSAVVGKITEDTVKRKRFSKWIIALIVILAMVVVLLFCVLFETKTLSISHKEQIEYIVENGNINFKEETEDSLENLDDLKKKAKNLKIKGYTKMNEEELKKAIEESEE